jgi:hypothetical protein
MRLTELVGEELAAQLADPMWKVREWHAYFYSLQLLVVERRLWHHPCGLSAFTPGDGRMHNFHHADPLAVVASR